MFEKYTPQQLRNAIEIELQKTDDPKTASIIAIKRLKKDPEYYETMQKAKDTSKLVKKVITNKLGKQQTVYVRMIAEEKKEGWIQKLSNIFGFKDRKQAMQKVISDYKKNELDKQGVTFSSWKDHLAEYFNNKSKWDKFFSGKREKKETTKKTDKKETNKKTEKKVKKEGLKLSLMKTIFGLYGGVEEIQKEKNIKEPSKVEKKENNFDTMPESENEIEKKKIRDELEAMTQKHESKSLEQMAKDEIESLKNQIKYAEEQIKQADEEWVKKEYRQNIEDNKRQIKNLESNFETMPESDLKADFERWKTGDLSGIEGTKFNIIQELSDGRKIIEFKDIAVIRNTDNGFVSYDTDEGDSGGISQRSFIEMMKNGAAIPVELKTTIDTGDGSKIKTKVDLNEKQKIETVKDEEILAREGYFNEKPSEILNIGKDVYGAARHNYDTYERFDADITQMEKDGTATAYVTKKNLLGSNGLANKDERVQNGETDYKVLASYIVRDSLPKMPENNEESRKRYMDFLRAVTRIDTETSTAGEFMTSLAEFYSTTFPAVLEKDQGFSYGIEMRTDDLEVKRFRKEAKEARECVGDVLHVLFTGISGFQDKRIGNSLSSADSKKALVASRTMTGELNGRYSYDEIKTMLLGKMKASGVKLKKGDNFVLTDDFKDKISIIKRDYKEGMERPAYISEMNDFKTKVKGLQDYMYYQRDFDKLKYFPEETKRLEDFIGQKIPKDMESLEKLYKQKYIEETTKINDKYFTRNEYFPEKVGQVVKAGKDDLQVAFNFPDGTIKVFKIDPKDVKPENIESIKKTVNKKKTISLNLKVERNVRRKGGKDFSDLTVSDIQTKLEEKFKVKSLQYGNSMPDEERLSHTRWTVEAFSDLSDILNIPMEQITVNGKLGMAFGARGRPIPGMSGGAIAHYEPGTKMINLTRANGFGSLAHEWGHFLDNILTTKMDSFLTETIEYKKEKFNTKEEIPHGSIYTVERGKKTTRYFFDTNASNPQYPFAKLNSGQLTPDKKSSYYSFRRYDMELDVPGSDNEIVSTAKEIALKTKDWLHKVCDEKIAAGESDYQDYKESSYLNMSSECFARAFEAYVADKLNSNGRENTYLSSKEKTIALNGYFVYPQEKHREESNQLFDKFFNLIRGSEDLKKAIKFFSKRFNPKTQNFEYKKVK